MKSLLSNTSLSTHHIFSLCLLTGGATWSSSSFLLFSYKSWLLNGMIYSSPRFDLTMIHTSSSLIVDCLRAFSSFFFHLSFTSCGARSSTDIQLILSVVTSPEMTFYHSSLLLWFCKLETTLLSCEKYGWLSVWSYYWNIACSMPELTFSHSERISYLAIHDVMNLG